MIFHLGFHKTGTSFLQEYIYKNLSGIRYVTWKESHELLKNLMVDDEVFYDEEDLYSKLDAIKQNENLLFSYEEFLGPLFYQQSPNLVTRTERIKKMGVKKVMFTIRNQYSMLDSIYRQYIQKGGVVKANRFLNPNLRIFNTDYCQFEPIIDYFITEFGPDNVLVILNEDLRSKQSSTIKKIEDFIDAKYIEPERKANLNLRKTNTSLSNASINLLRIINHFTYNYFRPSQLISHKIHSEKARHYLQTSIDPKFISKFSNKNNYFKPRKKEIFDIYSESNSKLNNQLNLGLERYDYPL